MGKADIQEAVQWATQLHAGQWRDGRPLVPYITHPIDVMNNLRLAGVSSKPLLIAAVLHDTIEETTADFDQIRDRFGVRVANLVQEVTRHEPSESEVLGLTADERYAFRSNILLQEIQKMSPEAHLIKLADRLSNLREAVRTRTGKKLSRYYAQTREILKIIPKETSPCLWGDISELIPR